MHERKISFSQPSADDRRADAERLRDAAGIDSLHIPLPVLKRLPFLMRRNQEATFLLGRDRNGPKIIDISEGVSYSVALDIGTTNIVAVLYDNVQRTAVLEMSTENPQARFGSDILTRMHHAMSGNAEEVSETLREGVNGFLNALCRKAGIQNRDIHGLVAAGNTVMSHFFLGLDIRNIPADP
ncbi:MAG: hypothetical protein ACM34I_06330, partial [bacterium]